MSLVTPLNKTINAINLVNEGREKEAVTLLGLECNREGKQTGAPFLSRVVDIAVKDLPNYSGGLLVSPDVKSRTSKEVVSSALDVTYNLTESIGSIVAGVIGALNILTEDDMEIKAAAVVSSDDDGPIIDDNGMENIKNTYKDGMIAIKDCLVNIFADTAKLNIRVKDALANKIGDSGKLNYALLASNAITAAGTLLAVCKINEFKNNKADAIEESINTSNIINRADTVLFSALDLQESIISIFKKSRDVTAHMLSLFNENDNDSCNINDSLTGDLMIDGSKFIDLSLMKCQEAFSGNSPVSEELNKVYIDSVCVVAALYDEYLQDYCNSEDEVDDNTVAAVGEEE